MADAQPTNGNLEDAAAPDEPRRSKRRASKPPEVAEDPFQKLLRIAQARPDNDSLQAAVSDFVQARAPDGSDVQERYNVLFLYDQGSLVTTDADRIYAAAETFVEELPILLVLQSTGGQIAPAYFISKICREYAHGEFGVAVPRRAKSAATLICCGADTIHMGILSELGPIDPQIDNMPTLGLKNAVEHLADLVKEYPYASDMFATYLSESLKLPQLGYYERVAESAVQYAERLLDGRTAKLKKKSRDVARQLVYDYKDHGFVIDAGEAESVFGPGIIKRNTAEYQFANAAYGSLDLASHVLRIVCGKGFYFTGTIESGCQIFDANRE